MTYHSILRNMNSDVLQPVRHIVTKGDGCMVTHCEVWCGNADDRAIG